MTPPTRRAVLRTGLGSAVALTITDLVAASGTASAMLPSSSARAALATTTACATLTPEETQGPFWVDERLLRSDVRADTATGVVQDGVPLTLTLRLQDAGASCAPQVGAFVDIWHANAQGSYSDVSGQGNPDNRGLDWLRGYQVSDDDGSVTFTTIWPGWYSGRTIHIHVRVRLTLADSSEVNVTSQLYFAESANEAVLATSAYRKSGTRDSTNATDGLYDAALLVPVSGSTEAGYSGAFTVNVDFGDGTDDASGTGGTGGTGSTGSTGSETDTTVGARVVSARVVRRRGRRVAEVVLDRDEKVAALVRLVRHDAVLAHRRTGWLTTGRSTVRMALPRRITAGSARIVVNVADESANVTITRKRVVVPTR